MDPLPTWLEDVVAAAGMTAYAVDLDRKPGPSARSANAALKAAPDSPPL